MEVEGLSCPKSPIMTAATFVPHTLFSSSFTLLNYKTPLSSIRSSLPLFLNKSLFPSFLSAFKQSPPLRQTSLQLYYLTFQSFNLQKRRKEKFETFSFFLHPLLITPFFFFLFSFLTLFFPWIVHHFIFFLSSLPKTHLSLTGRIQNPIIISFHSFLKNSQNSQPPCLLFRLCSHHLQTPFLIIHHLLSFTSLPGSNQRNYFEEITIPNKTHFLEFTIFSLSPLFLASGEDIA